MRLLTIDAMAPTFLDKLCARDDLAARVSALPKPIVFTNGVFDILHRGHVSYLAQARALGTSLVLALNSDASARMLGKGPGRPLNGEADHACVLAALESVSLVTLFDEATPVELLKRVRPQLYVKGGDYDIETLEETKWVRSWGGEGRALSFVDGSCQAGQIKIDEWVKQAQASVRTNLLWRAIALNQQEPPCPIAPH